MVKLSDEVYKVIDQKLSSSGYNADDEKFVMDILSNISTSKTFHKNYRDFALQWSYDIVRPSRRIKKIELAQLEVTRPLGAPVVKATRATKKEGLGSDEEQIFNEEGEELLGDEDFVNMEEEEVVDDEDASKKVSLKIKGKYYQLLYKA